VKNRFQMHKRRARITENRKKESQQQQQPSGREIDVRKNIVMPFDEGTKKLVIEN
jgi:hypothetical protein